MAARLQTLLSRLNSRKAPEPEKRPVLSEGAAPGLKGLAGLEWAWSADLAAGPFATTAGQSGRMILPGVKLFHDAGAGEITLRSGEGAGLDLSLQGFSGSFLSLVFDLPAEAVQGLRARHLIRLDTRVSADQGLRAYARLNIRHGPNTEQISRELTGPSGIAGVAEFDMFYVGLNERRVEAAWIDLIFNPAATGRIGVTDLTVSRRPRAAL